MCAESKAWCGRSRGGGAQTGFEIAEPTDSLSTLSGRYYEANARPTVAEYLDQHPLYGVPFPSGNSSARSYLSRAAGSRSIPVLCLSRSTRRCPVFRLCPSPGSLHRRSPSRPFPVPAVIHGLCPRSPRREHNENISIPSHLSSPWLPRCFLART